MGKHTDDDTVEYFDEDVNEAGDDAVLGADVKLLAEDELAKEEN